MLLAMQSISYLLFISSISESESEHSDSSLNVRVLMWGLVAVVELDALEVLVEIEDLNKDCNGYKEPCRVEL